jgi:PKD repeat protein
MKLGPRSSLGVQALVFVLALCIILAMPGIIMWKKTPDGIMGKKHENSGHNAIKSSISDLTSTITLYTGLLADTGEGIDNDSSSTPDPSPTPDPSDDAQIPTPAASVGPQLYYQAKDGATNSMYPVIQMNLSWKRAYRLEPIKFDSGSSYDPDGQITAYEWDFGDGSTGAGKSVEHAYEKEGNYTVRLRVVDDSGADRSANVTAIISDKPPVSLPGNDTNATVGKAVWFNGADSYDPDGSIVRYDWSFGDGTVEQGEAMMHVYDMPGIYNVTLKVTDDSGSNATASMAVDVAQIKATSVANLGGVQGIILQASAGITCLALIIMMRKRSK